MNDCQFSHFISKLSWSWYEIWKLNWLSDFRDVWKSWWTDNQVIGILRASDTSVYGKLFSLFLIQNICCGYSKEPSQWDGSFMHPQHMLKWLVRKLLKFYAHKISLSGPMYSICSPMSLWLRWAKKEWWTYLGLSPNCSLNSSCVWSNSSWVTRYPLSWHNCNQKFV